MVLINAVMQGVKYGQVIQAHVPTIQCTSDLTDYIAVFLIAAGKYSYFGCGNWNAAGNDIGL